MRFDTGEGFCYATNSAAATCSFSLTASTRNILINKIDAYSDASGAVVTVQASGTTLWEMKLGSGGTSYNMANLWIDGANAKTMSALVTASAAGSYIAVCGIYRSL